VKLGITGTGLALAVLTMAQCPAFAEENSLNGSAQLAAATQPSFVPDDFNVPLTAAAEGFKLVPLGPDLVKIDFDAYMSSIEHLQKTFSRSANWPRPGISDADAMLDMQTEQGRFKARKSFAYAVLTPDGSRERGSVYIRPSPVKGHDAMVSLWVTKAEFDAGFDAELYAWVTRWVQTGWPFKKVAYPGRAIEWSTWDSAVAASKAATAGH
jgi:hypothetical protein